MSVFDNDDNDWIPVARASRELAISRHAVLARAAAGELQARRVGSVLLIARSSIDAFLHRRRQGAGAA